MSTISVRRSGSRITVTDFIVGAIAAWRLGWSAELVVGARFIYSSLHGGYSSRSDGAGECGAPTYVRLWLAGGGGAWRLVSPLSELGQVDCFTVLFAQLFRLTNTTRGWVSIAVYFPACFLRGMAQCYKERGASAAREQNADCC